MKLHLIFLILLVNYNFLWAGPAFPRKINVSTSLGNIVIKMEGDEYCKLAYSEEGFSLTNDSSTWYYLLKDEKDNIIKSEIEARPKALLNDSILNVLKSNPTKGEILSSRIKAIKSATRSMNGSSTQTSKAVTGNRKVLIVLMQFPDVQFTYSQQDFYDLFNATDYSYDGAAGSVRDYYTFASNGQLDLTSDIVGPYTTKNNMSYYGKNSFLGGDDSNPFELFKEALDQVCQYVDLSEYDSDGNGYVDNIHIIYAGYGEEAGAESSAIWAHEMSFSPIDIQGVKIDRYSCAPELRSNKGYGISRIGPHCHEIGHALGAMDYYDTDYETGGLYSGTSTWDVMASGSWNDDGIRPANFNAFTKCYEFGWCDIEEIIDTENFVLKPSAKENLIYQVTTPTKGEFFLLENRQQTSFDTSCPGHGMLIYHVTNEIESYRKKNNINSTYPQNCYIVCASSESAVPNKDPKSYGVINSGGCPFPGNSNKQRFGNSSIPAAVCINGTPAGFDISAITEDSNGNIHFNINFESTGNPNSEDEDIPKDWDVLLQDNVTSESLNEIWQTTLLGGSTNWEIDSKNNNDFFILKCPFFSGGGFTSSALLTSKPLELNHAGKLQISFEAASSKFSSLRKDNLNISIIDSNTNKAIHSCQIAISTFHWQEYVVESLCNVDGIIIQIEGLCNIGSELTIDNICVKLSKSHTSLPTIKKFEWISDEVFDINGNLITTTPNKGFYIIGNKKVYRL